MAATEAHERSLREFVRAHRRAFLVLLAAAAAMVFILVVLPQITGLSDTLNRLKNGEKAWLALAAVFEAVSIGGYVTVFRGVFCCAGVDIGWRESYQITMAGIVATKFFAAAGAGGVALQAWALRRSGLEPREVARKMATFEIILYSVFMVALVVVGVGMITGLLPGSSSPVFTILPAAFGAGVIALALSALLVPSDLSRFLERVSRGSRRRRRWLGRFAAVPETLHHGMVEAVALVRRPRWELLGAIAYWGFDIAVLWASFRAFGSAPPVAVVVMGYFVGSLANIIPIPGGIGGVEGGMIGSFLAFGVNGSDAVLAVLCYRALSFWLPTVPGAIAYVQLRHTVDRWNADAAAGGDRSAAA
jgi:uncharacterized protein (TIRG00374 family)